MHHSDLNLLPVLRVLLEEANVTRAAERLHLSVSAASRALDRGRRMFDDPLLVPHGRGVAPTAVAVDLLPRLTKALDGLDDVFAAPPPFDPARIRRQLNIRAADVLVALIGTSLSRIVSAEAPGAVLRFQSETDHDVADLRAGDCLLGIGSYSDLTADLDLELLVTEPLVGVARAGGDLARGAPVSIEEFAAADHVVVSRLGHRRGPVDKLLAERGLSRRVIAVVPSMLTALSMVGSSESTTIAPRRVVEESIPGGLSGFELPFPTPMVDVHQVWHRRFGGDPEHRWLRGCVRRATNGIVTPETELGAE
ncbi:MAG: LysR family transcriptional regulator [Nocardioides sp.]